ncbi:WXG100 family type VII secretion target [Amycolatopsis sp. 195334CR]|uniref:WXG100 family type VII secretion target n=1 Tax=Amycolatopsis sp. 195334CR TaxID=2814588 RepID=UPI001A8DDCBC|nr:WXG100 family type VII secretion target [Amycolatopsis sp. 195334CR]MBN6036365.1 WXG100 family type VII secretion target [Amycolatopsis sp. 195334CR]
MSTPNSEPDVFQGLRAATAPPAAVAGFSGQKQDPAGAPEVPQRPVEAPPAPAEAEGKGGHLEFLSELSKQLGVTDIVEAHLVPVVGQWTEMRAEAERWRAAAASAGEISKELAEPLGKVDAGWEGENADAFVAYMGKINSASEAAQEAMTTMADALDDTADAIERITGTMIDVVLDAAEVASESAMLPVGGTERARNHLIDVQQSTQALHDSVRDVLEEFARLCDGVEGKDAEARSVAMESQFPGEKFALKDAPAEPAAAVAAPGGPAATAEKTDAPAEKAAAPPSGSGGGSGNENAASGGAGALGADTAVPSAPSPGNQVSAGAPPAAEPVAANPGATASRGAAATTGSPMMGGMMPMGMGGMGGGGQGGNQEHRVKTRATTDPADLFGKPEQVAPPVLGEDPVRKSPDKGT